MRVKVPPVSIIISTYNRQTKIKATIDSLLRLNYPKYEIVVVDDGSTDSTPKILKEFGNEIRVITHKKNKGTGAGKSTGILNAKYNYVALIDDDVIIDKNWLKDLTSELMKREKDNVAAVTSVGIYAGHSICYIKDVVIKAGLFDKSFSMAFREDTDLAFRIMDLGYQIVYTPKGKFIHDPPLPKTFYQKLKFIKRRLLVHQMDCLLFKKHPERTKKFLNIKFRIASPIDDFKRATGLWREGGKLELSSPQGVTILKGSPLTVPVIIAGGILYAILLIFVRLYGSVKYRTFLL